MKLGGGFGGTSGYKFDEMEQEADSSKKRLEKLSRGGIDHDDDDLVCEILCYIFITPPSCADRARDQQSDEEQEAHEEHAWQYAHWSCERGGVGEGEGAGEENSAGAQYGLL